MNVRPLFRLGHRPEPSHKIEGEKESGERSWKKVERWERRKAEKKQKEERERKGEGEERVIEQLWTFSLLFQQFSLTFFSLTTCSCLAARAVCLRISGYSWTHFPTRKWMRHSRPLSRWWLMTPWTLTARTSILERMWAYSSCMKCGIQCDGWNHLDNFSHKIALALIFECVWEREGVRERERDRVTKCWRCL